MIKQDTVYTVQEVAEILKVKPLTIYRLIDRKELKAFKVGRNVRIKQEDLDEYIEKQSK